MGKRFNALGYNLNVIDKFLLIYENVSNVTNVKNNVIKHHCIREIRLFFNMTNILSSK